MAKVMITICTDNAAFEYAPEQEVARILGELGQTILMKGLPNGSIVLHDINGNRVGTARCNEE